MNLWKIPEDEIPEIILSLNKIERSFLGSTTYSVEIIYPSNKTFTEILVVPNMFSYESRAEEFNRRLGKYGISITADLLRKC